MSQRLNNTKSPSRKENQLGILKIYAFRRKIQQRTSGLVRCWGYVSICEYTREKRLQLYLLV